MATAKVCPKYIEAFNNNEVYMARQLAAKYPQFSLSTPSTPTTSSDDVVHCLRAARLSATSPSDFAEKLFNATSNLLAPTNMSFNCSIKDDESQTGDDLNQTILESENEIIILNDQNVTTTIKLTQDVLANLPAQEPKDPILQVIETSTVEMNGKQFLRLFLSDGICSRKIGIMDPESTENINQNCIIKITDYDAKELFTSKNRIESMEIFDYEIISCGNKVGKVIGSPEERSCLFPNLSGFSFNPSSQNRGYHKKIPNDKDNYHVHM